MNGESRDVDIGILYDPKRKHEKKFCWKWRRQLQKQVPQLKYRMNSPYAGTMDGFSTSLRKDLTEDVYWGIELEVNQRFVKSDEVHKWQQLQNQIAESLKRVIEKE